MSRHAYDLGASVMIGTGTTMAPVGMDMDDAPFIETSAGVADRIQI